MHSAVVSRTLAVTATAEQVFHTLYANESVAIWTDSRGDRGSGRSILATGELLTIHGSPWQQLREVWAGARRACPPGSPLGVMVVLPYDALEYSMGISGTDPLEPVRVVEVRRALEVDEETGTLTAWAWADDDTEAWMDSLEDTLITPVTPAKPVHPEGGQATWRDDTAAYRDLISQAREAIRQGEVYQLCLTTSVSVPCGLRDWELHQSFVPPIPPTTRLFYAWGRCRWSLPVPRHFSLSTLPGEPSPDRLREPVRGDSLNGKTGCSSISWFRARKSVPRT